MKTLVVGLGNPILGDDGAGWKIAAEVEQRLPKSPLTSEVSVDCVSLGGLSLMERLIGYQYAIVIDTIGTGQHPLGTAYHFRLDDLYDPTSGHTTAAHDVSLMKAIEIGRSLGAALPERIDVVAIESPYVYDFSEELTPPVAAAVPQAVEIVMDLLDLPEVLTSWGFKETGMISPELLRRYPFFAFLDEAQLRAVAMLSEEIEVENGALVFDSGKPAEALCLLTEGSLDLYYVVADREDPELKKEFFLNEFGAGDVFGISALIEPYLYTASVRASAMSRVVKMDGIGLRALCEVDPRIAAGFMKATAKTTMERLNDTRVQLAAARA